MSEHTPGPWESFAGIVYVEGHRIAVATHEADARLISAAPDLLAACEALLVEFGEFDAGCPDRDCSTCQLLRLCEAAITKARGEVTPC